MHAVLNVRKRQWAYILFLEQVLLELCHVPPSLKQSFSVFAAFTSPAKAAPVKASARVTAKTEIKVFMAVSPLGWTAMRSSVVNFVAGKPVC
jgi:hypothetical protein